MIRAVTFEAHDNLIHARWFPRSRRLVERLRLAGVSLSPEVATAVAGACRRYEEDHHLKGQRVPDDWFRARDAAGLRAAGITEDVDQVLAQLREAASSMPPGDPRTEGYVLDPDVPAVLDALKARGLLLGIVSNMPPALNKILHELGIRDYFAACVTCGNRDAPPPGVAPGTIKPHPTVYAAACSSLGVTPQECLHVGDSPYDDGEFAGLGVRVVIYDPLDCLDVQGEHVSRLIDVVRLVDGPQH